MWDSKLYYFYVIYITFCDADKDLVAFKAFIMAKLRGT